MFFKCICHNRFIECVVIFLFFFFFVKNSAPQGIDDETEHKKSKNEMNSNILTHTMASYLSSEQKATKREINDINYIFFTIKFLFFHVFVRYFMLLLCISSQPNSIAFWTIKRMSLEWNGFNIFYSFFFWSLLRGW